MQRGNEHSGGVEQGGFRGGGTAKKKGLWKLLKIEPQSSWGSLGKRPGSGAQHGDVGEALGRARGHPRLRRNKLNLNGPGWGKAKGKKKNHHLRD